MHPIANATSGFVQLIWLPAKPSLAALILAFYTHGSGIINQAASNMITLGALSQAHASPFLRKFHWRYING